MRLYSAIVWLVCTSTSIGFSDGTPAFASDTNVPPHSKPPATIVFPARPAPPHLAAPSIAGPALPELQRPLALPSDRGRDRADRLLEEGKLERQRMRLERAGDPHDPRIQDRLRRIERALDALR